MKNKTYVIAVLMFGLGTIMLLGTSYSLINNSIVSDEVYGFNVADFDVSFNDDTKITVSGIPTSDEDGIKNSKEYTFKVNNNSDYDINYRLDVLENSKDTMGEVIHYVYSLNDSPYSDVLSLKNNYTIKQNKKLDINATDVYKIKIWLSEDADESYMNKSFSASIILSATQHEYKYASMVLERLESDKKDNVSNDNGILRYTKKDSPNYVWFNCDNGFTKGEDYCEKWRIIGSFNNKSENSLEEYKSLKIVSTTSFDDVAYNNEEKLGNYDDSYINTFANGLFYDKLSEDSQKLILKARWNIGEIKNKVFASAIEDEESKTIYSYVGLPNASDYLYLGNESFLVGDNSLLLNKTNGLVNVLNDGIETGENDKSYHFVPCVYLRGDVSIISGDGSINNPYELGIKFPMNY